MHLCKECENEGRIELARYKTTGEKDFSYSLRRTVKPFVYLCEKHLKQKTDYQIKNAVRLNENSKDPANFVGDNKYKN